MMQTIKIKKKKKALVEAGNEHISKIRQAMNWLLYARATKATTNVPLRTRDGAVSTPRFARLRTTPMFPTAPFFILSDDLLMACDPALLLQPVHELLGCGAEMAIHAPAQGTLRSVDGFRYRGFRRIGRLPSGFVYGGPPDSIFYEEHNREFYPYGRPEEYAIRLFGWSPRTAQMYPIGESALDLRELAPQMPHMTRSTTLLASIVEIAQYAWVVRVSKAGGLTVITDEPGIRALGELRDGPITPGGRRQPLLHWVEEHARRLPDFGKMGKTETVVSKHLRGIRKFDVEGYDFNILNPTREVEAVKQYWFKPQPVPESVLLPEETTRPQQQEPWDRVRHWFHAAVETLRARVRRSDAESHHS